MVADLPPGDRPTRAELERDRWEWWLVETYEERYAAWCAEHRLDPESTASAVEFEEWFLEQEEER